MAKVFRGACGGSLGTGHPHVIGPAPAFVFHGPSEPTGDMEPAQAANTKKRWRQRGSAGLYGSIEGVTVCCDHPVPGEGGKGKGKGAGPGASGDTGRKWARSRAGSWPGRGTHDELEGGERLGRREGVVRLKV